MKKLVLAAVMALVSLSVVTAPTLRAQDSGQLTIQNPAEFNAYQTASTQSDPAQSQGPGGFPRRLSAERGQETCPRRFD